MKELTVEITLSEDGELQAETFGFKGKVCESELRELLQGEFVVSDVEKKDDYYKNEEVHTVVDKKIRGTKK